MFILQNFHRNKTPIRYFLCLSSSIRPQTHANSPTPSNSSTRLFRFHIEKPKISDFRFHSNQTYSDHIPRTVRKRINKRVKYASQPILNRSLFQRAVTQLPPRFTPEELHNVITLQKDPLVCLELFNWASQQHRFKHNVYTYHITIKKLGAAKMYEEMHTIAHQVLDESSIGSESLYNTIIYYYTEARKLTRAVNIYKHMCNCTKLDCRPSIRTYNLLFTAFLSHGRNSYINHVYMETIRCLFKQMVDDGVEPDLLCLNSMIKGYVLSLHVNDALRIFHQMGVVYKVKPNSFSYDYLIHGLCAQGRTENAREIIDRMKGDGYVPSNRSYNSLVNALALGGEVDESVRFLWEMYGNNRVADFISYRTVLDEMSRQKRGEDAFRLVEELKEKKLVDGDEYKELWRELKDNSRNL